MCAHPSVDLQGAAMTTSVSPPSWPVRAKWTRAVGGHTSSESVLPVLRQVSEAPLADPVPEDASGTSAGEIRAAPGGQRKTESRLGEEGAVESGRWKGDKMEGLVEERELNVAKRGVEKKTEGDIELWGQIEGEGLGFQMSRGRDTLQTLPSLAFMERTADYLCWAGPISRINWRPKKLISRWQSFRGNQMKGDRGWRRRSGLSDSTCNNAALILHTRYVSSGSDCRSTYLIIAALSCKWDTLLLMITEAECVM